jgi:chlorobactene glucosyltransferase
MNVVTPLLWSLPLTLPPLVALWRASRSRSLDEYSPEAPGDAPFVSIIIPARNERRNIERCVRSALSAAYPSFEVIVVDDHSTDGTGKVARAIAADDPRLKVIDAPQLPDDWFGKQWACASGAAVARGTLLLFTDADTWHASDLLSRSVNAMIARDAEFLTVAPHQEMHSFWERVVQPQMFGMLSIRYGGTEQVSNTRHPSNAIANGQFILLRRASYEAMGGHELVKHVVAEDLALAQEYVRAGRRIALLLAIDQMSTHMYASLSEIVRGWRKNIFAGGRYAAPGGALGRILFPFVLIATPLIGLGPVIALILAATGVLSAAWFVWSAAVVAVALLYWGSIYHFMGERVVMALLYPLGLATVLYIAVGAVVRGRSVEWKDRAYRSS